MWVTFRIVSPASQRVARLERQPWVTLVIYHALTSRSIEDRPKESSCFVRQRAAAGFSARSRLCLNDDQFP